MACLVESTDLISSTSSTLITSLSLDVSAFFFIFFFFFDFFFFFRFFLEPCFNRNQNRCLKNHLCKTGFAIPDKDSSSSHYSKVLMRNFRGLINELATVQIKRKLIRCSVTRRLNYMFNIWDLKVMKISTIAYYKLLKQVQ